MSVTTSVFHKVGEIFLSSKKRQDAEYSAFLEFYRTLVEEIDSVVATTFGNMSVEIMIGKKQENYGLMLSATDYVWWKNSIAKGARFKKTIEEVKADMLNVLAKAAENNRLTADERTALLALLDQ